MDFAGKLKGLIQGAKIPVVKLAVMTGTSQPFLCQVLNGNNFPSKPVLDKILAVVGFDPATSLPALEADIAAVRRFSHIARSAPAQSQRERVILQETVDDDIVAIVADEPGHAPPVRVSSAGRAKLEQLVRAAFQSLVG